MYFLNANPLIVGVELREALKYFTQADIYLHQTIITLVSILNFGSHLQEVGIVV